MEDRELLELAAKAACITVQANDKNDWMREKPQHPDDPWRWWNPLENDGDALRLVVKLGLHIGVCIGLPNGDFSYVKTDCGKKFIELHSSGNSESATRRAIVCAAAEIGKSMP